MHRVYSKYHLSYFNDVINIICFVSVVILCASPPKVREVLLAAESLGLMDRGEYVFFNVELFAR